MFFIDYIIETIETYFESSANIPKKLEVDDFGHLFKQLFILAEQVNLQMLKKQYHYQLYRGFFLKKYIFILFSYSSNPLRGIHMYPPHIMGICWKMIEHRLWRLYIFDLNCHREIFPFFI